MASDIHVTAAAVIERDERFLLVEERVNGRLVLNQPAGHLDPGESLPAAASRETLEETGYTFVPSHLVGVYHWQNEAGTTFVRFTFCGAHSAPTGPVRLDEGIVAIHWLTRAQMLARERELRSPMVLRCVDDYLAGARHSLDVVRYLSSGMLAQRATK
ncbi:MAG TPA: NUDIX hydrolase [Gammaproteobacteria bacterium]|nr:NUDIX hydrolase [Gammaproteobacteria bacterium]